MALQQRRAQLLFKLGDLSADGRRRYVEKVCCRANATEPYGLEEIKNASILNQTHSHLRCF
jgi:hypothetical protein